MTQPLALTALNAGPGPIVLVVSHSDYPRGLAGTEKCISEQMSRLRLKGFSALHLYPERGLDYLGKIPEARFGINFNEEFHGFHTMRELIPLLERHASRIRGMYVHHLMCWQEIDFQQVADVAVRYAIPRTYFAHDFFSACPTAFLPCLNPVDKSVCIPAENPESRQLSCAVRNYSVQLQKWRAAFRRVLSWVDQVVVPSEFLRGMFGRIFPHFKYKLRVQGHLDLIPRGVRRGRPVPSRPGQKCRLAFLGYRAEHKGWDTWVSIFSNPDLRRLYDFYHVGSREEKSTLVKCVPYTYHDGGAMAATRALEAHDIDLVLLWSVVPESYSYTFYEAVAAGIPVLASRNSGNIAQSIRTSPASLGEVLENPEKLVALLQNPQRISELLAVPRATFTLVSAAGIAELPAVSLGSSWSDSETTRELAFPAIRRAA